MEDKEGPKRGSVGDSGFDPLSEKVSKEGSYLSMASHQPSPMLTLYG